MTFWYFLVSQKLTQISIFDLKYSTYPYISIAHSIRLKLRFLFLFLKVKSDHFSRFYEHFSDFLLVACGDTAVEHEKSNLDWKILGLSFENKNCVKACEICDPTKLV